MFLLSVNGSRNAIPINTVNFKIELIKNCYWEIIVANFKLTSLRIKI